MKSSKLAALTIVCATITRISDLPLTSRMLSLLRWTNKAINWLHGEKRFFSLVCIYDTMIWTPSPLSEDFFRSRATSFSSDECKPGLLFLLSHFSQINTANFPMQNIINPPFLMTSLISSFTRNVVKWPLSDLWRFYWLMHFAALSHPLHWP